MIDIDLNSGCYLDSNGSLLACPFCKDNHTLKCVAWYNEEKGRIIHLVECLCGYHSERLQLTPNLFFKNEEALEDRLKGVWNRSVRSVEKGRRQHRG